MRNNKIGERGFFCTHRDYGVTNIAPRRGAGDIGIRQQRRVGALRAPTRRYKTLYPSGVPTKNVGTPKGCNICSSGLTAQRDVYPLRNNHAIKKGPRLAAGAFFIALRLYGRPLRPPCVLFHNVYRSLLYNALAVHVSGVNAYEVHTCGHVASCCERSRNIAA